MAHSHAWHWTSCQSLVHLLCALRSHLTDTQTTATSVEAERAFSRGRLTISRLRHSLSDASVRASTLLGFWASIPALVPETDVVNLIRELSDRQRAAKGKAKDNGALDVIDVDAEPEGHED